MPSLTAKEIVDRSNRLKGDRINWDSWWQDLAKHCVPRKADVTEKKTPGTKFDTDIYDSTARDSIKVFAAGLMGYLTNPASPWFKLRAQNSAVMKDSKVATFYANAEHEINNVFHVSNFYQQLHEFYIHIGFIGTSAFYSEEDTEDGIRYYTRRASEILFDLDHRERLLNVYRPFELDAQQAALRWGDDAGKSVLEAMKAKKFEEKFEFIQCVGPRGARDPKKKDRLNKPFHSTWVNVKDQKKVYESGFEEMPFHIARFSKEPHEKYGYSPAMDVLPDIKMANKMKYIIIRASMKATDPPVLLPHQGYLLPLNFNPRAVNYKLQSTGTSSDEQIQFLDHKGNIQVGRDILLDVQETIKRAFFVDLFLLLADRKNMTATEVQERVEEKMLILGPAIGQLQNELLQPVISRTFNILLRSGRLGDPPQALLNNPDYRVEYVSVLAKAQKFSEARSVMGFVTSIAEISKVYPETVDKLDADAVVDKIAEVTGQDPALLRDDKAILKLRGERQQQQEIANKLALAQQGAEVVKTGGEAVKTMGGGNGAG